MVARILTLTYAASLLLASSASADEKGLPLVTEQFMIDASDPGIQLYIRNKRPEGLNQFRSEKTLLFVAWRDAACFGYLRSHARRVVVDGLRRPARLGRLSGGCARLRSLDAAAEMDQPPTSNPPIVTTDIALRDVGSAIDFVLERRRLTKLNLMGWSWGGVLMGAYAAERPDKVDRLVLYAPTWISTSPQPPTASPPLGAYRAASMATARDRLQSGAPEGRKAELMPSAWFDAWSAAALATDPVGSKQDPPVLRSPTGVAQDYRNYWGAGKAFL